MCAGSPNGPLLLKAGPIQDVNMMQRSFSCTCSAIGLSEWRTRADARYSDPGGFVIYLDIVDPSQQPLSSLQSCVRGWHRQGLALTAGTNHVALQLGRFSQHAGRVVKNTSAVGWETGRVSLPAFRDEAHMDIQWSTFCVRARWKPAGLRALSHAGAAAG